MKLLDYYKLHVNVNVGNQIENKLLFTTKSFALCCKDGAFWQCFVILVWFRTWNNYASCVFMVEICDICCRFLMVVRSICDTSSCFFFVFYERRFLGFSIKNCWLRFKIIPKWFSWGNWFHCRGNIAYSVSANKALFK